MAKFQITIDSILGGIAPNLYRGGPGQFATSIGIDPDKTLDGNATIIKTSGVLVPSAYAKFSGSLLDAAVNWIITNPKNETIYAVEASGKLLTYASSIDTETALDNTFTVTIASPAVFTATGHGLALNDRVYFYTTGALPTGLSTNTVYYVISAGLTANAFEVSATEGGSAVNTSGSQSGTHRFAVGSGGGAAYYNNYLYFANDFDVSRYGPLDNSPTLVHGVWRASTLGSQTALGNATYPALRGVTLPNHPMYTHMDNKLYVGDYDVAAEANKGRGLIHQIITKRTTDEGDTNNGSVRTAFALPFGYAPTAIAAWGNDLVVAAIPMSSTGAGQTIIQGKAKLYFWDAINAPSLPYREVTLVDPLVTALFNQNGDLFVWSGNMSSGVRVSQYLGGYKLKQLAFFEEGFSPPAGCVDGLGNRVVWGAFTTYPENSANVYALGYKDANLPLALHNIMNSGASATASQGMVTALKYAQHATFAEPRMLVAWRDASNFGIDKLGATSRTAVFRSLTYAVGRPFRINKITIPLGVAVASGMTLIPSIGIDDDTTASSGTCTAPGCYALTTINSTNYSASQKRIVLYPVAYGNNNFYLQLRWSGTVILPVTMPIIIEGETLNDATG